MHARTHRDHCQSVRMWIHDEIHRCAAMHLICLSFWQGSFSLLPRLQLNLALHFYSWLILGKQTNKRCTTNVHPSRRNKQAKRKCIELYHWLERKIKITKCTSTHTMPPTKTINACSHPHTYYVHATKLPNAAAKKKQKKQKLCAELKRCYCISTQQTNKTTKMLDAIFAQNFSHSIRSVESKKKELCNELLCFACFSFPLIFVALFIFAVSVQFLDI